MRATKKPKIDRHRRSDGEQPDRRLDLVQAAYEIIAHEGFENLRTRDVAACADVNIATLHYYYPTKEALIGGVALHLAKQFATRAELPPGTSALKRLHQEFADMRFYLTERPDMIEVMRELNARARRDPAVAPIIKPLKAEWRKSLEHVIAAGIAEGVFRSDLVVGKAAAVLVAMLWGAATLPLDTAEREYLFTAVESWLSGQVAGCQKEPKADASRLKRVPDRDSRRKSRKRGKPA